MKIIISPAKKLCSQPMNKEVRPSKIQFETEAKYLISQLRKYPLAQVKELMNLSDSLAKLNHDRFKSWDLKSEYANHAIYMFQGDVYKGLKVNDLTEEEILFAQDNLLIISGLYGILKPLDLIYPYRLEMGTKMKTNKGKNLYEFWGSKLNTTLKSSMSEDDFLINLASNEYSKAIKLNKLERKIITPIFKDFKNGSLKVVSFFAKKARGEMVNFILKNKINNIDELKMFSNNGYKFHQEDGGDIIFAR